MSITKRKLAGVAILLLNFEVFASGIGFSSLRDQRYNSFLQGFVGAHIICALSCVLAYVCYRGILMLTDDE